MGPTVHLLPNVSRKTLLMHRPLKPLLERIVELGMSYTWGHPFHLKVHKGSQSLFHIAPPLWSYLTYSTLLRWSPCQYLAYH